MKPETAAALRNWVKGLLTLVFGLLLPCAVTYNAFVVTSKVMDSTLEKPSVIASAPGQAPGNLLTSFEAIKSHLHTKNDYVLLTALYLEQTNMKTFISKQLMKTIVIHLGFAVMSIGLCFIILGINEGGVQTGTEGGPISFNFTTGSTGLAAFVIGAAMASGGGLLSNEYKTIEVSGYIAGGVSNETLEQEVNRVAADVKKMCTDKISKEPGLSADEQQRRLELCMGRAFLSP